MWLIALCSCHPAAPPTELVEAAIVELPVSDGLVIAGRIVRAGSPVPGVTVSYSGALERAVITDANGDFELSPTGEFAIAPAIHLVVAEPDQQPARVALRNAGGRIEGTFELGELLAVQLRHPSDEDQAWIEAQAWAEREARDWQRTPDDLALHRSQWARVAATIAAEPDGYKRGLLMTAQFHIGRSDDELGLERRAAAEQALTELGFEDPRWSISPWALAAAVFATGRWAELAPTLDALISEHPQPDVAGYLAVERYMSASAEGRAVEAAAIWRRWLERPALAQTAFAAMMLGLAAKRPLGPGQPFPDLCVDELGGQTLCIAELRGRVVVVEFWSTWCRGCRTAVAELRTAHSALADRPERAPQFVSIDVYDDAATLAEFLATEPMPWRQGFIADEAERDPVRERLQIVSIPALVLIDVDGTIIASHPELRADQLVDRVRALTDKSARE